MDIFDIFPVELIDLLCKYMDGKTYRAFVKAYPAVSQAVTFTTHVEKGYDWLLQTGNTYVFLDRDLYRRIISPRRIKYEMPIIPIGPQTKDLRNVKMYRLKEPGERQAWELYHGIFGFMNTDPNWPMIRWTDYMENIRDILTKKEQAGLPIDTYFLEHISLSPPMSREDLAILVPFILKYELWQTSTTRHINEKVANFILYLFNVDLPLLNLDWEKLPYEPVEAGPICDFLSRAYPDKPEYLERFRETMILKGPMMTLENLFSLGNNIAVNLKDIPWLPGKRIESILRRAWGLVFRVPPEDVAFNICGGSIVWAVMAALGRIRDPLDWTGADFDIFRIGPDEYTFHQIGGNIRYRSDDGDSVSPVYEYLEPTCYAGPAIRGASRAELFPHLACPQVVLEEDGVVYLHRHVQVIHRRGASMTKHSLTALVDNFDLSICKMFWNREGIFLTTEALQALETGVSRCKSTAKPERMEKYRRRGFEMEPFEVVPRFEYVQEDEEQEFEADTWNPYHPDSYDPDREFFWELTATP